MAVRPPHRQAPAPATRRGARGWRLGVAAAVGMSGGLPLAGAEPVVVIVVAIVIGAVAMGEGVYGRVLDRRAETEMRLAEALAQQAELLQLERLDGPTHGRLDVADEALSVVYGLPLEESDRAVLVDALNELRRIEADIRRTQELRSGLVGAGGVAGRAASGVQETRSGDPMHLYQADESIPQWIRAPRLRDALRRVGAVLDDVRTLHDAEIEWSVLLFTLWARLVLVGAAALVPSWTAGVSPLADGVSPSDAPWMLALASSAVTAVFAPAIATAVMRRDASGATVRRILLAVEVPVAVAALLLTPSWMLAAFAAGWTNWWQRPVFNWVRLAAWIAAVASCLALGWVLAGVAAAPALGETVVAFAVIGIIGGSYGAMLPISATLLLRVVLGGLLSPRRARSRADERLREAVQSLVRAADVAERAAGDDAAALRQASKLRSAATSIALAADGGDRWAARTPTSLGRLIEDALGRAAFAFEDARAATSLEAARIAGEEEPLTYAPPAFRPPELASWRLVSRNDARALALAVVEITREAARYGTRQLSTTVLLDRAAVRLRFANEVRRSPRAHGRGTGQGTIEDLLARIPGAALTVREIVPGSFMELPPTMERFGVEIVMPIDVLEPEARAG